MTDLETRIRLRCVECGDCLLWTGRTNDRNQPKLGDKSARRALWQATRGPLRPDQLVTVTCGRPACLAHLAITTKGEVTATSFKRPDVKARHSASVSRAKRPKGKLSIEKARYIRASDKTGLELAAELNVSTDLISKVRHNKGWREVNPFAGLGA